MLGRAKYNRLQIDQGVSSDFRLRDYRKVQTSELFEGLETLGVSLDESAFEQIAEDFDSPEELGVKFAEQMPESGEQIYLLFFELWRRLLEDRETISIFCDELDHLIVAYEQAPQSVSETVAEMLLELVDILDCNADAGKGTKTLLKRISDFSAFHLESFVYGFILDLIKDEQETLAGELLESFFPYVKEGKWFELLKLRLMFDRGSSEFRHMVLRFEESLAKAPEFNLDLNFLYFLIEAGSKELFMKTFQRVLRKITSEKDYLSLAELLYEYNRLNDFETKQAKLSQYLQNWQAKKRITDSDHEQLLQYLT